MVIVGGSQGCVPFQLKNHSTEELFQQREPVGLSQTSVSILWVVQVLVTVSIALSVCTR